jgi:hypothetical protein
VGDRFGSGRLLLESCGQKDRVRRVFDGRCGQQIRIGRDVVDRFKFEHFSLERCGRHVPIGTVHMERGDKTHLHEHLINGGGTRHYKLLQ